MLRFCDPQKPQPLVTHLFSMRVTRSKSDFKVSVVQIYPKSRVDFDLLKKVELFCFPEEQAIESESYFSFLVGDVSSDFKIGYIKYRSAYEAQIIISDFYYPWIFKAVFQLNETKFHEVLCQLSQPLPRTQVIFGNDSDSQRMFPLDGSFERQYLLGLLFRLFSPFDISIIIMGMLQSRHIFVLAQKASLCSLVCAALPLLTEPFHWSFGIIPILPVKLRDAAEVPVPTLIGLTSVEILAEGHVAPHIAINADFGHVIANPPLPIDELNVYIPDFSSEDTPNSSQTSMNSSGSMYVPPTPSQLQLSLQAEFVSEINRVFSAWENCPGFPAAAIWRCTRRFIVNYLFMFTGPCENASKLFPALKNLPEILSQSQMIHEFCETGARIAQQAQIDLKKFQKTQAKTTITKVKPKKKHRHHHHHSSDNSENSRSTSTKRSKTSQNSKNSKNSGNSEQSQDSSSNESPETKKSNEKFSIWLSEIFNDPTYLLTHQPVGHEGRGVTKQEATRFLPKPQLREPGHVAMTSSGTKELWSTPFGNGSLKNKKTILGKILRPRTFKGPPLFKSSSDLEIPGSYSMDVTSEEDSPSETQSSVHQWNDDNPVM